MRWLRLLWALLRSRFHSAIAINGLSRMNFRVWITDVDASYMNHAALLTVMEAGRIDFMVRSGFFALARKNGWYVPSASISVRFFRPLRLFQKAELITRLLHVEDHWVYLEQVVKKKGKTVATCLVKSTVKKGREHIPARQILLSLGMTDDPPEFPEMVSGYENHLHQMEHCNPLPEEEAKAY